MANLGSAGCRYPRPAPLALLIVGTPHSLSLTLTNQGVEFLGHSLLGRHPVPQQAFKSRYIQLSQQQPKRGIRGDLPKSVPSSSFNVWRWRLAKRSIPTTKPWPLRIERMATSSNHHWGKRIRRRIRQSGNALRKLICPVSIRLMCGVNLVDRSKRSF